MATPTSGSPSYVDREGETTFERYSDIILGLAFGITAAVAARRMSASRLPAAASTAANAASGGSGGGSSSSAETTVVTAFYSLIGATGVLRALWFLIPASVWQPSYTPMAIYAWDNENNPSWVGATLSELTVTAGSLTLFCIFILILVYWADILKKYFEPGTRRSLPMQTFFMLVAALCALELINLILFLSTAYTTEGMILCNAVLLAVVSITCVFEISIFSHRFRTVLKTLGAINQVSTDSQVRRIVWITVTGNIFFVTRAVLESMFSIMLFVYWHRHGTVDKAFSHAFWDAYTLIKYWSEVTILGLMLYILQSRFNTNASASGNSTAATSQSSSTGYSRVPDAVAVTV